MWKRPLAILIFVLGFPALAAAQFTAVTGTVTDPNGIPYANGTITPTLTGISGTCTFQGFPVSGNRATTALDATGSFALSLPDNNVISCAGTKWQFTVSCGAGCIPRSSGTGPQSFTVTLTITGASQSISAQLNAAAPALSSIVGGGGGGTVTHTLGALTLGQLLLGNGAADIKVGDLTGDATTSGSAAVTVAKINGTSLAGLATGILKNTTGTGVPSIATGPDLPSGIPIGSVGSAGLSGTAPVGVAATGVVSCATCVTSAAPLANKGVVIGQGGQATATIDFPNVVHAPAADCVNAVAGSAWSTGATPLALCRAGTNNKDALLSPWGAADVGYFKIHLPKDWDAAASTDLSIDLTSTDAVNGHTIIMQASTSCAKGDGTTTDDVAFNAAQSFGTITLNGNANRTWTATLTGLTTTGCAAQGIMWIKISRTADTATNVGVYGATVDVPRLLTVQAQ